MSQAQFTVTQENAKEVAAALGLGEPLIMADAPPMVFTRVDVDLKPVNTVEELFKE